MDNKVANYKVVALLPMKKHSERVKNKNFKNLAGKPLFMWMLDTLLSLDEIQKVVINTDSRDLLAEYDVASDDRILIRDRKPELCGDFTSMNRIIADDLSAVGSDVYIMTHTTNPLISRETIRNGLLMFKDSRDSDSVFSVNKIQSRLYRENGEPINHDPGNLIRTQDLEPWYEENSCFYCFTKESFAKTNARIGAKPSMMISPRLESIDIDEPEDWDLVCAIISYRNNKG